MLSRSGLGHEEVSLLRRGGRARGDPVPILRLVPGVARGRHRFARARESARASRPDRTHGPLSRPPWHTGSPVRAATLRRRLATLRSAAGAHTARSRVRSAGPRAIADRARARASARARCRPRRSVEPDQQPDPTVPEGASLQLAFDRALQQGHGCDLFSGIGQREPEPPSCCRRRIAELDRAAEQCYRVLGESSARRSRPRSSASRARRSDPRAPPRSDLA